MHFMEPVELRRLRSQKPRRGYSRQCTYISFPVVLVDSPVLLPVKACRVAQQSSFFFSVEGLDISTCISSLLCIMVHWLIPVICLTLVIRSKAQVTGYDRQGLQVG